jgi:hypothetical protein
MRKENRMTPTEENDHADTMSAEEWEAFHRADTMRAWSAEDLSGVVPYHQPVHQRPVVKVAAALAALSLTVLGTFAAAMAMVGSSTTTPSAAITTMIPAGPISQTPPPQASTPPPSHTPTYTTPVPAPVPTTTPSYTSAQDARYLVRLIQSGLTITSRDQALIYGHWVCDYRRRTGADSFSIANYAKSAASPQDAEDLSTYLTETNVAIEVYCP